MTTSAELPYPHTPEEHRRSFIAQARGVEAQLFSLSQDVYNELADVWAENPPIHTEIAERIKKVLEAGMARISADHLVEAARAADKAWDVPVQGG